MINWAEGVNKRILRASSWETQTATVADETRCGRKKVRMSGNCQPQTFSVRMHMKLSEKKVFMEWFKESLFYGANTFAFPQVDALTGESAENREYRFVPGSSISWSNVSADILEVSMQWEEV